MKNSKIFIVHTLQKIVCQTYSAVLVRIVKFSQLQSLVTINYYHKAKDNKIMIARHT